MDHQCVEPDIIGQYYSSLINKAQPGVFCITVHLRERVNPASLQQAVNDMAHRLPLINGRLRRGFFGYDYEILAAPPLIVPAGAGPLVSDYDNSGSGHILRVLYGERCFAVEATHSICDGRGLTKIASALLLRYFELRGSQVAKGGIISCSDKFQPEEGEDAYIRYAKTNPYAAANPSANPPANPPVKAYRPAQSQSTGTRVMTQKFSAAQLKAAAKKHNATLTEYILAYIFQAIAPERAACGSKRPITVRIPIDCRRFLPSPTLRNFVSDVTAIMPETDDFSDMIRQIHAQLAAINKESVLRDISQYHCSYHKARLMPRMAKKLLIKSIRRQEAAGQTTGFSNVGRVHLPAEIEHRVDSWEFALSLEENSPYFLSCITVGDVLALSATFREGYGHVMERIMKSLYRE